MAQESQFDSSGYLERQLQTDFLDEFFKILGWDVSNKNNLSPIQREVLVEKGDTKGRPDYTFRIDGEDRFFVEAKAPSKGTNHPEDIFQAKTYGWNTSKVNVVVLTDFKSFKIYDSSLKPDLKKPKVGLIFDISYLTIASTDFEKIWFFSKNQVLTGSLKRLISTDTSSRRARIPVETAFLEEMYAWREKLAKNIFKNNNEINVRTLNDVVQRILDRFIFIRILEDRKIIESKTLHEIEDIWKESKHRDLQPQLNALFKQLNDDFNGEIFKEHPCETIKYDSEVVAEIIEQLYFPVSPYNFAVIPVEILGIMYEKYLGKTIRITGKRIKIEEKPEVRKAGGVYYTPKWVVKHIVNNTVGNLIRQKTPEEIAQFKILDPACGSGSFLIGALEKLFEYHHSYYLNNPKDVKRGTLFPALIFEKDSDGKESSRLSIEKKSEILRNNIFGVDLDPQAVEITMMSLYIKVLEGEKALPHDKEFLPKLTNNIKCGNSLVGFDIYRQTTLVGTNEKEKINAFEWQSKLEGFGKICTHNSGFDVIIGNPPYIRIQTMKEWAPREVEYFSKKYQTAKMGNYDIYVVFVEKAIDLLKNGGLFGFILPNKFFQAEYGQNLRLLISKNKLLDQIINFTDQQVFHEATTYTCLLFLSKKEKTTFKYVEIKKLENPDCQLLQISNPASAPNKTTIMGEIYINELNEKPWQFALGDERRLLSKLNKMPYKLESINERIYQGIVTGSDPIFVVEKIGKEDIGKTIEVYSKSLDKKVKIEKGLLKPLLKGQEIKRYSTPAWKYYLLFPYLIESDKAKLIGTSVMDKNYPNAWKYLNDNKKALLARDRGKLKVEWYAFGRTQNIDQFFMPKIMTQVLAKRASFTLDKKGIYYFVGGGNAGGYGVRVKPEFSLDLRYLVAILNSKLLEYCLKKISTPFRGGFYSYARRFIQQLPIYIPDPKNNEELNKYNSLIELTDRILELNKIITSENNLAQQDSVKREIIVYEEQINRFVYDLYRISPDEEKLIESEDAC